MDKVKGLYSLLIVILYIGLGVYFLMVDKEKVNSYPLFIAFGIIAIAYGVFRAIRIYKKFKSQYHEDNSAV